VKKLYGQVRRMAKFSKFFMKSSFNRDAAAGSGWLCSMVMASTLLLAACAGDMAVEIDNAKAAQELARLSRPPGSVYTGWRMFQERCAACHGPDATGSATAPDLLPLVQQMGPRRFVGLVLTRYDWNLPPTPAGKGHDAMETLIEEVLQRKESALTMPAWQDNPAVNAHIADLYAYLSARAEGVQGRGRPLRW
jgi:mono/diheme cytochrome c family protein